MDEITTSLTELKICRRTVKRSPDGQNGTSCSSGNENTPREVPFCPSGNLATKLHDTPRYLFRVYSQRSAGYNSSEWMKSPDALKNMFTDICTREDSGHVAITLNEHLRWSPKSDGDPFISWTTSLLVAVQYAIYKHKTEHSKLSTIYLCIIDTTLFPSGVFIKDLDLMEEFHDKVPNRHPIKIHNHKHTWGDRGLNDFRELRNKKHTTCSGVYYFGEYLSQGQTNVNGRSCTVSCDKIINDRLLDIMPQFKAEMNGKNKAWANAVIEHREPFYSTEQVAIKRSEFDNAKMIASEFGTEWLLPMLANLLASKPRPIGDPANIGLISALLSNESKHELSLKYTNVVANDNIPEVFQFGKIIDAITQDYYDKSVAILVQRTADIVHRYIRDSRATGGRKMLDTGNLAEFLPAADHDHMPPLIQSLEKLSGLVQQFQEDMALKS